MLFSLVVGALAADSNAKLNPLGQVLELMDELSAKIIAEGEAEAAAYHEFFEWCDSAVQNAGFEIKEAQSKKEKLEAAISMATSDAEASSAKIEDLAGSISSNEADLKSATEIRAKEQSDFVANENELMEAISTLGRAINILEREMAKNPAAFAQVDTSSLDSVLKSLSAVVDAASFSNDDRQKLLALVQSQQGSSADDEEFGAPAAAAYKSHSSNIVDVLEDLKEKAEEQLATLRKEESNAQHNYDMLKQSLEAQTAADTKNLNDEKAAKSASEEARSTAVGDLDKTLKDLADAEKSKATAGASCMQTAADHEATVKAREEELKVIAEAKKILMESSSGAVEQTYSLIQLGKSETHSLLQTRTDLATAEVITLVKRLAQQQHSSALAQLASRIAAIMHYGAEAGEDPFTKVKSLISDMIVKLENEAHSEATEKAYCDEQLAKTEAKKGELEDDIAKLTAKLDQSASRSAELKEEVKELESELAILTKQQAEMDKIRGDNHAAYVKAKAELEVGLAGVRKALGLLREYYGSSAAAMLQATAGLGAMMRQPAMPEQHVKATGAGTGIIGILEVVESDFAKNLASEETEEADAASEYEKTTQENKISKTLKDQDIKYKTQEYTELDKSIADLTSDRESADSELAAVMQYYAQIRDRCIAKPETYEDRQKRREAEIAGLKEALNILENETALMQRGKHARLHHFLAMTQQ